MRRKMFVTPYPARRHCLLEGTAANDIRCAQARRARRRISRVLRRVESAFPATCQTAPSHLHLRLRKVPRGLARFPAENETGVVRHHDYITLAERRERNTQCVHQVPANQIVEAFDYF